MSDGAPQAACSGPTEAAEPRSPKARRGSRRGVAALVLVLIAMGALFGAMTIVGLLYGSELEGTQNRSDTLWALIRRSESDPDTGGHRLLIGGMVLGGLALLMAGLACGVWALASRPTRRATALSALVLGGGTLLCLLASFIVIRIGG